MVCVSDCCDIETTCMGTRYQHARASLSVIPKNTSKNVLVGFTMKRAFRRTSCLTALTNLTMCDSQRTDARKHTGTERAWRMAPKSLISSRRIPTGLRLQLRAREEISRRLGSFGLMLWPTSLRPRRWGLVLCVRLRARGEIVRRTRCSACPLRSRRRESGCSVLLFASIEPGCQSVEAKFGSIKAATKHPGTQARKGRKEATPHSIDRNEWHQSNEQQSLEACRGDQAPKRQLTEPSERSKRLSK